MTPTEEILRHPAMAGVCTAAFAAHGHLQQGFSSAATRCQATTWFDLASLTKPLFTAITLWRLCHNSHLEWGQATLGQLVSAGPGLEGGLLPRDRLAPFADLRLLDLLEHTSGLPAWRPLWMRCASDQDGVSSQDGASARWRGESQAPGPFCYSDLGFIILAAAMEHFSGQDIRSLWRRLLAELNLSRDSVLDFGPLSPVKRDLIPCGTSGLAPEPLHGLVHDDNCRHLGGASGHAGMFGSGSGIIKYLQCLAGEAKGARYFHELDQASRQAWDAGKDSVWGWRVPDPRGSEAPLAELWGPGTIGHYGFTGTALWWHPQKMQFCLLLTNRVINGWEAGPIKKLRVAYFEAAARELSGGA